MAIPRQPRTFSGNLRASDCAAMIRYKITKSEIEALIAAECPGWLADAKTRTEQLRRDRKYSENAGNWSKIKAVYMRLQHCKCAYCERKLASEEYGRIE